jgi:polar amino acid transport system substrate-binding protein
MRQISIIILLGIGLCLLSVCSDQDTAERPREKNTLLIGTDPNYPPFEFVDSVTGELIGFDIELIQRVCEANGWQCEFARTPFGELMDMVSAGRLDLAISAITITPDRQALVDFSEPYYLTGQTITVPIMDTITTTIDDLRGKRVGVQSGTVGDRLARSVDGVHVFPYDNPASAVAALADGKLDATVDDYPVAREIASSYDSLRMVDITLDAEYYGVAVRKGEDSLRQAINSYLAVLLGSPEFDSLHVKWFGYPLLGDPD